MIELKNFQSFKEMVKGYEWLPIKMTKATPWDNQDVYWLYLPLNYPYKWNKGSYVNVSPGFIWR
jgi:hypothetical protein